jgi:CBS domain-containing protein
LKKIQETSIIEDASVAFEKVNKILFSAEKEVMVLTSSKGVIRLWENKVLLKNFREKGIRLKIIAPITSENLEPAREISKHFNIRHIAACHSRMTVVDGKHLFQFNTLRSDKEKIGGIQHLQGTIYTNNLEYVRRTKTIFRGIWKDAFDLSKVIVASIARKSVPAVTLSTTILDIALIMTKRNIGAVIVQRDFEPLGIITERDLIERVLLSKKDPCEIVAQEIMTAPLITVGPERTIDEALEIMARNHVRRLVVVKGDNMVGILTERRLLLTQNSISSQNVR